MSNTRPFCQDLEMYAMDVIEDKPCPTCEKKSEDPRCPHLLTPKGLNKLAAKAFEISIKRNQKPDDVFKHMAGEVIEAQEARQDMYAHIWEPVQYEIAYADELADVIICALSAAGRNEIDIEAAITRKMMRNEQRAKEGK